MDRDGPPPRTLLFLSFWGIVATTGGAEVSTFQTKTSSRPLAAAAITEEEQRARAARTNVNNNQWNRERWTPAHGQNRPAGDGHKCGQQQQT